MYKLLLLYRTPEPGQFFDEEHYHKVHLATALEFIGKYGAQRLEIGRAVDIPRPRPNLFYRYTELYFRTLEDARACVFSPEMTALNPDARNYHNVGTTGAFYENEEHDFAPDQTLGSVSGAWADYFEERIGKAGLALPPGTERTIPPRPGTSGEKREGRPGFHDGLLPRDGSDRPVKSFLFYRPVGEGQFFDEDHYHRIHLATGLEFLGKCQCRRLEIGRVVEVPEFASRTPEFFRYTSLYFDDLEKMQTGLPTPEMLELSKDEVNYHNVGQTGGWFEREVYQFGPDGLLQGIASPWKAYFADRIGKAGLGLPAGTEATVPPRAGGPGWGITRG